MVDVKGANPSRGNSSKPASKRSLDTDSRPVGPNGSNPAKRSRVSRACDQCRSIREKCDGAKPQCHTCRSQNRACSYNEQPKKRGIQPNYTRTLELTIIWLFQNVPETEARLSSHLPQDNDVVHRLISGKDQAGAETLHEAWRECLVNRQIDQMLSGVPIEKISHIPSGSVQQDANSSNGTDVTYDSLLPTASSEQNYLREANPDTNTTVQDYLMEDLAPEPPQNACDTSKLLSLPANAWTLLEYYFAFTHSWLPMTEKHSILKLMYSYPREGVRREQITLAEHAELWSIMAPATTQVADDTSSDDTHRIRDVAESLIPAGNASFEVPHIKAMLMLCLIDIHGGHMVAAWLRIGSVVRLLSLFKLLENLGSTEMWCRHIHLAAFVLETTLALRLKTAGHFRVSYIEAVGLVDEDGMDEWAPWRDPLSSDHGELAKAPARSFSTLNELVRMSLLYCRNDLPAEQPSTESRSGPCEIVFALLQNASLKQGRVQPSTVVRTHEAWTKNKSSLVRYSADLDFMDAVSFEATGTWAATDQAQQIGEQPNSQQSHAFMSIPNEVSPVFSNLTRSLPGEWSSDTPRTRVSLTTGAEDLNASTPDIFEELAMLERTESSQNPQFMQNLGFAPDLDLAEFFGADYQPSDPLLAYMQPTLFGTSQGHGGLGAEGQ